MLPCTTFPVVLGKSTPKIEIPWLVFPDARLPAPAAVPPMVLLPPPSTAIPSMPLAIASVPSADVPAKLPWTMLPVDTVQPDPMPAVTRDDIASSRIGSADRVIRGAAGDLDARTGVCGSGGPGQIGADVVPFDEVPRRPAAVDVDTRAVEAADPKAANGDVRARDRETWA